MTRNNYQIGLLLLFDGILKIFCWFKISKWNSCYFSAWLFCKSIWYHPSIYICSKLSNNSISIQQSNHASNDSIQWNNLSILHSSCTCTCNTITTTSISFTISTTHATISTSTTSSLPRGMTHILAEKVQTLKWTVLGKHVRKWTVLNSLIQKLHGWSWSFHMTVHIRLGP